MFALLALVASAQAQALNVSGVSGTRFSGDAVRALPGELLQFQGRDLSPGAQPDCDRWIVVTTIFEPTPATRKLGELSRWCYVVVADVNGQAEYPVEGVVHLTVARQLALNFRIVEHLPWRHFGRKNVGYLYAIAHGAKVIYDTDDDNRLTGDDIPLVGLDAETLERRPTVVTRPLAANGTAVFNPYPPFGASCGQIWPRGFPLDLLPGPQLPLERAASERPPAVQQFLADEDPDVDAIFRLTRALPCSFEGPREPLLKLPAGLFAPYNAQATVHLYESFWGLLLPVTVHGRVSDIWRAYLTQRLLWDVGHSVAFHGSRVIHDRAAHDYLKDFASEQPLYLKATALVSFLSAWRSGAPTLVERLEQLWAELYERTFVELGDLQLAQAWIRDLLAVGYEFPRLEAAACAL